MSSPATTLCFFLLSILLLSSSASVAVNETLTVYEALEEYDFPVGLLPLGVTSYTLDRDTGEFEVNIGQTCTFSIDGYTLRYKSTISGVISKDKLTNLKGVSVKILLFYINIVEVTRDGDELDFSVGILSAGFGIENFVESPQCGCGFDCNSLGIGERAEKKMDLKKLLMSSF